MNRQIAPTRAQTVKSVYFGYGQKTGKTPLLTGGFASEPCSLNLEISEVVQRLHHLPPGDSYCYLRADANKEPPGLIPEGSCGERTVNLICAAYWLSRRRQLNRWVPNSLTLSK